MTVWEVEVGPDDLKDLLRDGSVVQTALSDTLAVQDALRRLGAEPDDDVEVWQPDGSTQFYTLDEYLDL